MWHKVGTLRNCESGRGGDAFRPFSLEEAMGKAGRRWVRWSQKKRSAFLDHLAGSCNVRESAEAAGVSATSAYALRRKDADFADQWHEALLAGYEVLETAMVGHALSGGDAGRTIVDGAGKMIDVDTGLRLLSAHRNGLNGKWRGGPKLKRASEEETNTALTKKLDAIEKRMREAGA